MRRASMVFALVVGFAGCAPDIEEGYYACSLDTDCPDGWSCRTDGRCWRTPGTPMDGGMNDAALPDAALPDGALPDGGMDACVPSPMARDVDLLVMVDKSASMVEEQSALANVFPELIRGLATGDVDGDGTREFEPISSLQVGVVSSDMGALGNTVATCSGMGDDGVLIDRPLSSLAGCASSYPRFIGFMPGDSVSQLATDFECVATVGTAGCGFEQQLEAVLKATVDADSDYVFYDGTVGHGDGANLGFLREDSLLITLLVSDEEDCSTLDTGLFDTSPSSPYDGTSLNLRCYLHDDALTPVSRYIDGLRSLRSDPADLVFGAIVGVPTEVQESSYADMLGHADMDYEIDSSTGTQVLPACNGAGGRAFPGRRYIEVAQGLDGAGAGTLIRSICESDFTAPVSALLTVVAPRLRARSCE